MNELESIAGSHHGIPDLLMRDMKLICYFKKWVSTVRNAKGYDTKWLPSEIDCLKSRLFWRIRSGKDPLKDAPPTCFSCPWYEVIEIPGPHSTIDPIRIFDDEGKKYVSVAQCRYELIESASMDGQDNAATIGFGPYRFKAWNATKEYDTVANGFPGKTSRVVGHIQIDNPVGLHQ